MRRPLLGLSLCFSLGILCEEIFQSGVWMVCLTTILFLAGYFLLRRKGMVSVVLLYLSVVSLGAFRLAVNELPPRQNHLLHMIHGNSPWVSCEGVIVSDPEIRVLKSNNRESIRELQKKTSFTLRVETITQFGNTLPASGYLKVIVRNTRDGKLFYGDKVKLRGKLNPTPIQKNFYLFDYSTWLKRQGIFHVLSVEDLDNVILSAHNKGFFLTSLGYKLRANINKSLRLGLENETELSSVLSGMILGYRDEIPANISEEFQRTGTFHILAVSGQNLTFLAFVFIVILRSFGLSKWRCGYVVLPVLVLYCASVGWQPGCLRAFWMAAVVIGAWMMIRPFDLLNALGCAALITLGWNPQELFDLGFQFSFSVVLCLIILTPWVWDKIKGFFEPDPFLIRELISHKDRLWKYGAGGVIQMTISSGVAWIASLPFTLYYFHTFAPVTVLANMFIIPMATIILSLGLISFLGSFIHPWIALLYNNANYLFIKILLVGIHFFSTIPGGCIYLSFDAQKIPKNAFILHCLEAGNSQSYILQTEKSVYVIDTGNENCARFITIPYLKALGVNRVDGLILSHADAQHTGGAVYFLKNFPVDQIWMNDFDGKSSVYNKTVGKIMSGTIPVVMGRKDARIILGEAGVLEIIYPPLPENPQRSDQSCPLVLIRSGQESLLMTFDLAESAILHFLQSGEECYMGNIQWIICGFDQKEKRFPAELVRLTKAKGIIFSSAKPDELVKVQIPEVKIINTDYRGGAQIIYNNGFSIQCKSPNTTE